MIRPLPARRPLLRSPGSPFLPPSIFLLFSLLLMGWPAAPAQATSQLTSAQPARSQPARSQSARSQSATPQPSTPQPDPLTLAERDLAACRSAAEGGRHSEASAPADRAEQRLRRILAAEPDSVEAHLMLARVLVQCRIPGAGLLERGRLFNRAEPLLERALELAPGNWEVRWFYGVVLYNVPEFLGRTADAARLLETTLAPMESGAVPLRPEPYLYLGDLYRRQGRDAEARATWRRGLERLPGNAELRQRLER